MDNKDNTESTTPEGAFAEGAFESAKGYAALESIVVESDTEASTEQTKALSEQLDDLSQKLPELGQKREQIEIAGREIIQKYGIEPEFFNSPARVLVFCAIAERWSQQPPEDQNPEEKQILEDSCVLLGRKFSGQLMDLYTAGQDHVDSGSDDEKITLYDRFTDKQLTTEVRSAISEGRILGEVKERLGITEDNEDEYEVRVLNISFGGDGYDIIDPEPQDLTDDVSQWLQGLEARGDKFSAESGTSKMTEAWVGLVGGKRILCLPAPLAEKLLDPSITQPYLERRKLQFESAYTSAELDAEAAELRRQEVKTLDHEYTHTQGGLNLDNEIDFGINIEELRAEISAGFKEGGSYRDVKGFFQDIATISGIDVVSLIEGQEKGGSQIEIYESLSRTLGLRGMFEVLVIPPRGYIETQGNEQIKRIDEYLGGYDGVLERAYHKSREIDGSAVETRINERAKLFYEKYSGNTDGFDVEWALGARKAWYELGFLTGMLSTIIRAEHPEVFTETT